MTKILVVDPEEILAAAERFVQNTHFSEEPELGPDGLAIVTPDPNDPDDDYDDASISKAQSLREHRQRLEQAGLLPPR